MELVEDNNSLQRDESVNGLENLSSAMPPESHVKSKKAKTKDDKDKKKKKKRDKSEKGERKLKVKELEVNDNADEDVDGIIKQKYGDNSDAGSINMSQQRFGKNMKPADMSRTAAAGFGAKLNDPQKGNLMNESMNGSEYNNRPGPKGRGLAMTLDVGDDQLSQGNYSAGGSRYVVGIKNPHGFYGAGQGESGNFNESVSQGSAGHVSNQRTRTAD